MKGELQLAPLVQMNRVVEPEARNPESESSEDVVVFQATKQQMFEKGTKLTEEEIAYKQTLAKMNVSAVQNQIGIKIQPSAEQRRYFKISKLPQSSIELHGGQRKEPSFGLVGMTEQ